MKIHKIFYFIYFTFQLFLIKNQINRDIPPYALQRRKTVSAFTKGSKEIIQEIIIFFQLLFETKVFSV